MPLVALVVARELLEQLQRGRLRRRRRDLAAAEVLELRIERGVHGDLVAAGVLQHDRRAAAAVVARRAPPPVAAVRAATSTVMASSRQWATASARSLSLMSARWW